MFQKVNKKKRFHQYDTKNPFTKGKAKAALPKNRKMGYKCMSLNSPWEIKVPEL